MKKLLFVGMMSLASFGAIASKSSISTLLKCNLHYTVVDEDGCRLWEQDVSSDTCAHALILARYFYSMTTGDYSIYYKN